MSKPRTGAEIAAMPLNDAVRTPVVAERTVRINYTNYPEREVLRALKNHASLVAALEQFTEAFELAYRYTPLTKELFVARQAAEIALRKAERK